MSGSIEHSVTLEDVFSVVGAKRVPVAPELAGYLALEIAEACAAPGGDVDPKSVFVSEEGTVALVRAKDPAADPEASVRAFLQRLLEASGSQTPALGAAARRKAGTGIRALVEELEAALIPVNRAAGRRALARLARDVKRVTAGVGRNAAPRDRPAPLVPRPGTPAPPRAKTPTPPPPAPADEDFPDLDLLPRGPSVAPDELPTTRLPDTPESSEEEAVAAAPAPPNPDAVDELLASFEVSGPGTDRAVSRELKAMVGLEPTPAATPAATRDPIDSLLAISSQSIPIANVRRPATPSAGTGTIRYPPRAAPGQSAEPAAQPFRPPPGPLHAPLAASAAAPPPPGHRPPSERTAIAPLAAIPPQAMHPPSGPVPMAAPAAAPPQRISSTGPAVSAYGPPPPPPAPPSHLTAVMSSQPAQPVGAPAGSGSRHAKTVMVREHRRSRGSGVDRLLAVLTLLVLVGGVVAVWLMKPGFFTGRTSDRLEQERQAAALASAQALAAQQQPRCKATLGITEVPANAEVLLRVGQAPVDIERMPVGARLEFVATAEGYAPKRTIIPAGATWDPGADGRPRFELGVQLEATRAKPGGVDPWPAGEPGSVVGGKGAPGTVHVVSTPRGAELWLLVGAGPEATIDPIRCDVDADILVAGPTTFRKRLHVAAADIAKAPIGQGGGHVVKLSTK